MFIRRNVHQPGDEAWTSDLLWYARAVQAMAQRPLDDRTSWRFWAAIHGFDADRWTQLGYLDPGEPLPSPQDRATFWRQCQHGSWYFLPWHRGYLFAFENTVRAAIDSLGGPAETWALPYWDYFARDQADLPAAFADQAWPDGRAGNPLFVTARYGPGGDGDVYIPMGSVTLRAFRDRVFTGVPASPGFGGIDTGFSHSGSPHGRLEGDPHDLIHVEVGGRQLGTRIVGAMGDPRTAGLDPIFWLHHANIDRLWVEWLASYQGADPTDPDWLGGPAATGGPAFTMPNPDGSPWTFTPADVLTTQALGYEYDDLTPNAGAPDPPPALAAAAGGPGGAMPADQPRSTEMVGASDTDLPLRAAPTRALVGLDPGTFQRATRAMAAPAPGAPAAEPERVLLNLENVRGTDDATVVAVYVGLPDGADPAAHPELLAGNVGLFGVSQASDPGGDHAGEGITYVIDISDVVRGADLEAAVEADQLPVTLVPRRPSDARNVDPGPDDDVDPDVTIGRVTIFREGT